MMPKCLPATKIGHVLSGLSAHGRACPLASRGSEHDAQLSTGGNEKWACPTGEMFTRDEFLALALTEC
jgi:hypothetical protein